MARRAKLILQAAAVLVVAGIMLIIGGLVILARELSSGLAEPLARLSVAALLISGAVVTVSTSVDGFGMKALALAAQAAPASEGTSAIRAAMAVDTMAYEKIVFAKSYRAQESPSTELPERVSRPSPCHHDTGFSDWAETVTPG